MYWGVALLVLLITGVPQAKAEPLLNQYRQIAGLTPVKLDRQLSAGCMEHANYMVQNQGTDATAGLNPHTQRSNLPGASAAGAACAKATDLFLEVSDLRVAIDEWMAGTVQVVIRSDAFLASAAENGSPFLRKLRILKGPPDFKKNE
jgi:hypothetical protein